VWFVDGTQVARLTTSVDPPPPSFATDVKPFFTAHCRSCHATGANYAPQIDLETYATARSWAQASLRRITDTLAPMPPASAEILTPAQYDVVVRWVEGGLLP
jgi:mono/diheme cytochrome c family protein